RPRHRGGDAAGLEGAGGVRPLVLQEQPLQAGPRAEPRRREQRRVSLAERDDVLRVADREQLPPAPHAPRASGDRLAGEGPRRAREVVAGEENLPAVGAESLQSVGVVLAPAGSALEMRERASGFRAGGGHRNRTVSETRETEAAREHGTRAGALEPTE